MNVTLQDWLACRGGVGGAFSSADINFDSIFDAMSQLVRTALVVGWIEVLTVHARLLGLAGLALWSSQSKAAIQRLRN